MSQPTSHSAGCHSNHLTFLSPVTSYLKRPIRLGVTSRIEREPQNRHVSEIAKSSFCVRHVAGKRTAVKERIAVLLERGGGGEVGGLFWVESGCIRHDNPTFANLQASQDSCIRQKRVSLSILSVCGTSASCLVHHSTAGGSHRGNTAFWHLGV